MAIFLNSMFSPSNETLVRTGTRTGSLSVDTFCKVNLISVVPMISNPSKKGVAVAEFGLVKSFNIDDGQLDGLRPQECFVLGYELGEIDRLVIRDEPISRPVHKENRERIEKSCHDAGREFTLEWMENDVSESWMWLDVAPIV